MIAYIQVQPTANPETFRVDLENHTDTLRISELYSRNTGMDDDRYPDYKSEHEIISQIVAGITTIKGVITQAKVASRRYDEDLDDYVTPPGWIASFKLYNQTFNYLGIEHQETSEDYQETSEDYQETSGDCQRSSGDVKELSEESQEIPEVYQETSDNESQRMSGISKNVRGIPENIRENDRKLQETTENTRRTPENIRAIPENVRKCQETSEVYQGTSGLPGEIHMETDKDLDPIGDTGPEPGELLIIPPDIGVDSKPWGEWVRDTRAGCFEYARHFNKPVYFCDDDGSMGPICNVDLAYRFKNLDDNPNLLNSCPEAFKELRADLGVSYFFEKKNEVSE